VNGADELRQLADRLDATAAGWGDEPLADDLRAAAVALRHHANLTAAIGDPEQVTYVVPQPDGGTTSYRVRAAVSPPPAPTSCPECGSDDPAEPYVVPFGDDETYCYHPWHEAAT
jgi:hypothetical protein